ncbi:MAG: AtzG-like protein [Betaproteobacteria bacterium]
MPPLPDLETLSKYIAEAQHAHGLPIDPAWRAAVAEHYRRLLEAQALLEDSGIDPGASEPAVKYEP